MEHYAHCTDLMCIPTDANATTATTATATATTTDNNADNNRNSNGVNYIILMNINDIN